MSASDEQTRLGRSQPSGASATQEPKPVSPKTRSRVLGRDTGAEADVSEARPSLLNRLASTIASLHPARIVRIAIDGVDGAGKTTLADALAPVAAAEPGIPLQRRPE